MTASLLGAAADKSNMLIEQRSAVENSVLLPVAEVGSLRQQRRNRKTKGYMEPPSGWTGMVLTLMAR